ncbi:hypothetical protein [Limnobaculum xujianqingii]|uniref:hypothetical protein n=1 Tax=Limnobaculum xujianqingii TaxID=2738837 RepID=UPI001128B80A|nr:hypothetical protein [Limnobaculum xujianqingii]
MTFLESVKIELEDERKRLLSSIITEKHEGIIVEYVASCSVGNAEIISKESKKILLLINENSFPKWPDLNEWLSILPKTFTDLFSNSFDEEDWGLSDWLYWFELENRAWFLWNVEQLDGISLKISILIYEHPFPSESLEVLFMKLGTSELKERNIY